MALKVTLRTLLDAGCHYGHQSSHWNPKMKPYLFGKRNGLYILDLKQTILSADKAYTFLQDVASKGGTVLFIGTKKQAQEPVINQAERAESPSITNRWLGGLLTNFVTIKRRIEYMKDIEAMQEDGRMETLPKKEQLLLIREHEKLEKNLNGVRELKRLPDALFVIDTKREEIAIKEARRLGIPVVGVVDTNSDPDLVDYPIPANDDAARSIALMAEIAAEAIISGKNKSDVTLEEMKGQKVADTASADADAEKAEAEVHATHPVMQNETSQEVVEGKTIEEVTTADLAEKTHADGGKEKPATSQSIGTSKASSKDQPKTTAKSAPKKTEKKSSADKASASKKSADDTKEASTKQEDKEK